MVHGFGRLLFFFSCPLFLFLAFLATAGCGNAMGDLTGTVKYKNKELPFGFVTLLSSDGRARNAKIEAGGTYQFTAVPVGEARFTVSCVDPKIADALKDLPSKPRSANDPKLKLPRSSGPGDDPLARFYLIPREYEDVANSKLTFQVEAGSNVFDIELK